MAKRKQGAQSAGKGGNREFDSLLLRSAESLGRMIGALQRQLDSVSRHLVESDGNGGRPAPARQTKKNAATPRKKTATPKSVKKAVGARRQSSRTTSGKSTRSR